MQLKTFAIRQGALFSNMFVEKFDDVIKSAQMVKIYVYTKDDHNPINYYTNNYFKVLCAKAMDVTDKITRDKKKIYTQKTKDIAMLFPSTKESIARELVSFAFQVFRSYEKYMYNPENKKNCHRNMYDVEKYNLFIEFMIDKIFCYLSENLSQLNESKDCYEKVFKEAFFHHSKYNGPNSKTAKIVNSIGIVLIDDSTNERIHFVCKNDKSNLLFRLMYDDEMRKWREMDNEDVESKMRKMYGDYYIMLTNVKDDYQYVLYNTSSQEFIQKLQNNVDRDDLSYESFDIRDLHYLYVDRPIIKDVIKYLHSGHITVVTGLKGSGKTELATKIAWKMMDYNNVFWIDGKSSETIKKSFERLYIKTFDRDADMKDSIESIASDICKEFEMTSTLFILDECKSFDHIKKYLSCIRNNNMVFITSTSGDWNCDDDTYNIKMIHLDAMSKDETRKLVQNYIGDALTKDNCEKYNLNDFEKHETLIKSIDKVINFLPNYPLIMLQATNSMMKRFKYKFFANNDGDRDEILCQVIEDYMECCRTKYEEIVSENGRHYKAAYGTNNIMYPAILLMLERLNDKITSTEDHNKRNVVKAAVEIMNMLTFFSPDNIPLNILRHHINSCCESGDKENFYNSVIDVLSKNLIIKKGMDDYYINIEELVQIVNKIYLYNLADKDKLIEKYLAKSLGYIILYANEYGSNHLKQHIKTIWEHASKFDDIVSEYVTRKFEYECPKKISNDKQINNTTFLHIVTSNCNAEIVSRIVNVLKDDINLEEFLSTEDRYGTLFHHACMGGRIKVVELLFNLNDRQILRINNEIKGNMKKCTPLHYAAKFGRKSVVEYLLKREHIKNCVTEDGYTPLHFAASNSYTDIVELLLDDENVNLTCTDDKLTSLHLACQKNVKETVAFLLKHSADKNAMTKNKKTPLHYAAYYGYNDIIDLLLNDKDTTSAKVKDVDGYTPLHHAVQMIYPSTVRLLLNYDRSVIDEKTSKGDTPLHLSCRNGDIEVIKALMDFKSDVHIKNNDQKVPNDLIQNEEIKVLLRCSNIFHRILGKV